MTTDGVKSSLHYSRVQMQGVIEQDAIVDLGQLNLHDVAIDDVIDENVDDDEGDGGEIRFYHDSWRWTSSSCVCSSSDLHAAVYGLLTI